MPGQRAFLAAGLAGLAMLAGGCTLGGGYEPGPAMDFTIENVTGSTVVVRFDLGVQSSTDAGLIERVRGSDLRIETGRTIGHSPSRSRGFEMERRARDESGALVWQVEVRALGSSWEEPRVNWFELRDRGPVKLSLMGGIDDETGERTVFMKAAGQYVNPIPREHWPEADSE